MSLVMALLGCGYTHFVCLDTFDIFSSFRNLRVKCFQQCPSIFDTYIVSFYYANKITELPGTEASRAPYCDRC